VRLSRRGQQSPGGVPEGPDAAGRVYATVVGYFQRAGWHYDEVGDRITVVSSFKGRERTWSCIAQAVESQKLALFYSVIVDAVPLERRAEATVLVTRANYGMLDGAFELDLDGGELRFRTSVSFGSLDDDAFTGGGLAESLFGGSVISNVLTADRYFEAIVDVAEGRSDGTSAVALAEGGPAGDVAG